MGGYAVMVHTEPRYTKDLDIWIEPELENARAVLNAKALRYNKIGRSGPRLTARQDQRLAYLRNAIEHSDEKLLGKGTR